MKTRDIGLVLLVCLIWAANQIMSRLVVTNLGIPPIFYSLVRSIAIAALLLPMLRPLPRNVGLMIAVGVLLGGGAFALNFMGLEFATPSTVAVVLQLSVPMATVLSITILGERIRWKRSLGIALSFGGVIILLWDPKAMGMSFGLIFTAASALSSALGAILLKKIAPVHPLRVQAWGSLGSIPLLTALSATLEHHPIDAAIDAGWTFVAAIAASALIVSIFSHTMYYRLVQKYEANQVVSLMLLHSVMTIVLGVLITGDAFTPRMLVGGAITLVGVFIIAVRSAKQPGSAALIATVEQP